MRLPARGRSHARTPARVPQCCTQSLASLAAFQPLAGDGPRPHARSVHATERRVSSASGSALADRAALPCCREGGGAPQPARPPRSADKGIIAAQARWLFQQLVIAIDYCHRKGIVNRDLKLENTLLHWHPGRSWPTLKLCDFGYSKNEATQARFWVLRSYMVRKSGRAGSSVVLKSAIRRTRRRRHVVLILCCLQRCLCRAVMLAFLEKSLLVAERQPAGQARPDVRCS